MVLGIVNQFQNLDEDVPAVSVNNDDRNTSVVADAGELPDAVVHWTQESLRTVFPTKEFRQHACYLCKQAQRHYNNLLTSKKLAKPVDISVLTIMLICVKKVLRNGRNALAWCAKDSEGEYKDGTLPSGKSIDNYHRFIRERDIRRKGVLVLLGDDDKADDNVLSDTE